MGNTLQYIIVFKVFIHKVFIHRKGASQVAQQVKNMPAMQETRVRQLGQEDILEEEMATYSSILAWSISWTEMPGRLQFMGSQRDTTEQPSMCTHTHTHTQEGQVIFSRSYIQLLILLELKLEYLDFKSEILSVTFCF